MPVDHLKMLYNIGELNSLFAGSVNIDSLLQKIVEMISSHMQADVCSIYLFDENSEELVLKATKGLNAELVNKLKFKSGEGLVGLSIKELRPINEKSGRSNPHFKLIPGLNEDAFESFLANPITLGAIKLGVITIQRKDKNGFSQKDIMALQAASAHLASMIENARFIIGMSDDSEKEKSPQNGFDKIKFIKGKIASEGFAYSSVIVANKEIDYNLFSSDNFSRNITIDDFKKAVQDTEIQILDLQKNVGSKLDDDATMIFAAHLLMLKDKGFMGSIIELIESGTAAPAAILAVFSKYKIIFSQSPSPLIREKIQDIEDLVIRILDNLVLKIDETNKYTGNIVITKELYPSELLKMAAENISGIILVSGGVTSHVSILARSFSIPVIIVDNTGLLRIPSSSRILLDAEIGNIYINPTDDILKKFHERNRGRERLLEQNDFLKKKAETTDGIKINVMANINLLSDLKIISGDIVDGIGLYRTEFPFLIRNGFPTEDEQFFVYKKLVDGLPGKSVTFRTLDVGGDKVLTYLNANPEANPFLGMRSIRFSMEHKDVFIYQLRAILRAGFGADIGIMFPMIDGVDVFNESRSILKKCISDLGKEGIPHNSSPKIGLMIEIPSAVAVAEELADAADFLSIGTNDLIQYTLAVDRTNEKVSHLYVPHHPSVLRSLKIIADAALKKGKEVSICGDMASSKKYIPFLIGIGIRTLSVDSMYIPKVKKTISETSYSESEKTADEMLSKSRMEDIEKILNKIIQA